MLDTLPQCTSCEAWPRDVCEDLNDWDFDHRGMLLPYLMGLATLLSTVIPVALALLLLVRMEQALGFQALRTDWIRGHVVEQLSRLRRGYAPLLIGSPAFVAVQVCMSPLA
jgi:hypothetical protein